MTLVKLEVAVQSSVFVALVSVITQVSLLTRTNVAAVAAVFDRARRLAAWRIVWTFARVHTLAGRWHRLYTRTDSFSYSLASLLTSTSDDPYVQT